MTAPPASPPGYAPGYMVVSPPGHDGSQDPDRAAAKEEKSRGFVFPGPGEYESSGALMGACPSCTPPPPPNAPRRAHA